VIELIDVSRTVTSGAGPLTILHPTSLRVAAGKAVAVTGPSGSGKSTLLGLIAGLDTPTTGRVLLDQVDVTALGEEALARLRAEKVGIVFQFFHLIPTLTALENVLVPLEIAAAKDARRRSEQMLELVGLGHRLKNRPPELSGGEQQRVAIARALVTEPAIVWADEPTGNLDSVTGRHIVDLLVTVNRQRGQTLVIVTHDPDLAAFADETIALKDGRVVEHTVAVAGR